MYRCIVSILLFYFAFTPINCYALQVINPLPKTKVHPIQTQPSQLPKSLSLHNRIKRSRTQSVLAQAIATDSKWFDSMGMPSEFGWGEDNNRLNRLTELAQTQQSNRPVVCEYEPAGQWLWKKWDGTVFKMTWRSILLTMGTGLVLDILLRRHIPVKWGLCAVPPMASSEILRSLAGVKKMWEYHLTVTTFILTFFLSHAYGYWQKVYDTTRIIQGRINDFCMLLVVGAQRGKDGVDTEGSRGYSDASRVMVDRCTRLIRLSHTFFWAATPTASNGLMDSEEFIRDSANCPVPIDDKHIGPWILSSYGLKALVASEQLTVEEAEDLINTSLPPTQYAYVLLVWVGLQSMEGMKTGVLRGGNGFEENLLRQLATLRASLFDIDDFRAGRMPLAYVQLVQVMVDSLMILAPFALYAELGSLSIPLVGLLTLFFCGLFKLSKSFLDPFGVEGFPEQNIREDVLVSELNFGAAQRWRRAGELPVGKRRLFDQRI